MSTRSLSKAVIRSPVLSKAWCIAGSVTYITFTSLGNTQPGYAPVSPQNIQALLSYANTMLQAMVQTYGGGTLLSGGQLLAEFTGDPHPSVPPLFLVNANNHQLTYGVAAAAVQAIINFLTNNGGYAPMFAQIYDGVNMVGQAVVGYPSGGWTGPGPVSSAGDVILTLPGT